MAPQSKDFVEDTKAKIFRVAARLFSEKGYNGVSMREISEKSGVTKPTIYYHFGNKEQIYRELVETGLAHIFSSLESIRAMNIPVKEKLVLIAQGFFRMSREFPEFVKFYLGLGIASDSAPFYETFKKETEKQKRVLIRLIQEGKESGEFGPTVSPELAVGIFSGTLAHFIWQQFRTRKRILSDHLAEEIIDILFRGLNE